MSFFHKKKCHKIYGPPFGPVTLIFCWPKAVSGTDVCLSCIRFPLNNLSLPQVNYLKSIHKIRDHIKQDKFDFVLQKLFQL